MPDKPVKIFISYAREDFHQAKKLYDALKHKGVIPWMDKVNLRPGQNWKLMIPRAIRESRYFLALLSSNSLSKKGYVQKELKMGLDMLDEIPGDDIFLIPIRLEECSPVDEKLQSLHWADLFPDWEAGFKDILSSILYEDDDSSVLESVQPVIQKTADSPLGMKFVFIPAGTFMMGSPESEYGRSSDEILHRVTLTKGFFMQTAQVTVGQWRKFTLAAGYKIEEEGAYGWTGEKWENRKEFFWDHPGFEQSDDCPVTCVSWNDALKLIEWLNTQELGAYRLPTEAEWEYSCRAGTGIPFFFGNCLSADQANYDGNYPYQNCPKGIYRKKTVPVGSFPANGWGLHDMHGNVWEWCQDLCDWESDKGVITDTYTDGIQDPLNTKGSSRVIRGGGWFSYAVYCRSANRYWGAPGFRGNALGFRLARSAP